MFIYRTQYEATYLALVMVAMIGQLASLISCFGGPEAKLEASYEPVNLTQVAELYSNGGLKSENLLDSEIGYDMKTDYYFFQYNPEDFSTRLYEKRKIIAAGQNPDANGQVVPKSKYPFAIVQKSSENSLFHLFRPTITDRFDVKTDAHGNQYFGVYDGHHGNRVVNRVRAMLLRKVVNAVKDKLVLLDMVTHPLLPHNEPNEEEVYAVMDFAEHLQQEIGEQIKTQFRDVDSIVQENSLPTAVSGAAGSIVIVTKYNLIVAYLGTVRVITYDQDLQTKRITKDHSRHNPNEVASHLALKFRVCPVWPILQPFRESCDLTRSFGSTDFKTQRYHRAEPDVEFVPRYFLDSELAVMATQFVVLETSSVATRLSDQQVTKRVVEAVQEFRDRPQLEQSMYQIALDRNLQDALNTPTMFKDLHDFSIMLVGLEKDDYENVH